MEMPREKRYGDEWTLVWDGYQIAMALEEVKDSRDGVIAKVTVESAAPERMGRLVGPVRLNLLSMQSQNSFAKSLHERLKDRPWPDIVTTACAIVVSQFSAPSPTIDLAEVDLEANRMEYLISGPDGRGLIPLGETTFCYGDSESLKSMLGSIIAACVLRGMALPWGVMPSRPLKVLYCDWETHEVALAERMHRLALGLGLTERLQIRYRGTLVGRNVTPLRALHDEVGSLREQIQREGIGLVIIDSIGFAVDGKLVDDDVARGALAALRQLTPATRLVIAHISKESAQQSNGRVDPFGSAFFRAGIRSGFEVRRSSQESLQGDLVDVGVYHWKSNDGAHVKPFGLRFHFEPNNGPIRVRTHDLNDVPDLAMRTSLSSRLRNALRGGASTIHQLAEDLDANADSISRTLRRMPDVLRIDGGGQGEQATWGLRG